MADRTLAEKVVVLTGASSGLGKGTARELAARGASLVLAARRGELLDELARECEAAGGRAVAAVTDVGDPDQVERLAERAEAEFGPIDLWYNVAGVGAVGRFHETPLAVHDAVIRTTLLGVVHGSHVALRRFRARAGGPAGTLVNVASVLGKIPAPYYAAYTAAKYGVVGLGDVLRQELSVEGVENVRVCTVMPMALDTPFFEHAANTTGRKAVPIPPVYDVREAIEALVEMASDPRDETIVGGMGKAANVAHHLTPGMVEAYQARTVHKVQMEDPPPAPNTDGNVFEPMAAGSEVDGGWSND
ncbi:SDR family oxidoreductase [Alienimonas sp. DA493]|uniref:SDR family oxidoreductase n=1 Tax=Alienimonas sp. DA493 TaxID=3373605 RepID=UPI003754C592